MTELESQLAISTRFSEPMLELAASIQHDNIHIPEKYRRVISHLLKRLVKTSKVFEGQLEGIYASKEPNHVFLQSKVQNIVTGKKNDDEDDDTLPIVTKAEDLLVPLRIMHHLAEMDFDTSVKKTLDGWE
jgi:phosphoenolpyruvate carboxylase